MHIEKGRRIKVRAEAKAIWFFSLIFVLFGWLAYKISATLHQFHSCKILFYSTSRLLKFTYIHHILSRKARTTRGLFFLYFFPMRFGPTLAHSLLHKLCNLFSWGIDIYFVCVVAFYIYVDMLPMEATVFLWFIWIYAFCLAMMNLWLCGRGNNSFLCGNEKSNLSL